MLVSLALAVYCRFAGALFLALTLAVVCRPLYESLFHSAQRLAWLKRRPGLNHALAAVGTQLLVAAFVCVCVLIPLAVLSSNRNMILNAAANGYAAAREWSRDQLQSAGEKLHVKEWTDFDELPEAGQPSPSQAGPPLLSMQDKLVEIVSRPAPFLPMALKTMSSGAMWLGELMFFLMALHFLLLHGPRFWADVLKRCPDGWKHTLSQLSQRARMVLMATVVVHGLNAAAAFLLALPVFWIIVGTRHFMLMAMLAGFFQLIPLLGSVTFVSLVTLYFFASGRLPQAWECLLLAFPLVVGLPDLWLRPYLARRYGKVHSLTMLAGFATGFQVFGILGFVLGPLVLDLIVQFTRQVLGEKSAPLA